MVYKTVSTPFTHLTMKTPIFQAKGGAGVGVIGGAGFASLVTSLKAAKVFRTRLKESVSDLLMNINVIYFRVQLNVAQKFCPLKPSLFTILRA